MSPYQSKDHNVQASPDVFLHIGLFYNNATAIFILRYLSFMSLAHCMPT